MALQQDSAADTEQPTFKPLSEASDLPRLTEIPGTKSLSDPLTPVRYLGLCCGASVHLIRLLVHRGKFFAELYLCDKDPVARQVALASLR